MAEAQKLIAMSITKIKSSRGQRGGINLCKNLLVSTVLIKARTAYMKDNFQSMIDLAYKRQQPDGPTEESDTNNAAEKRIQTDGDVTVNEVICSPIENSENPSGISSENNCHEIDSDDQDKENTSDIVECKDSLTELPVSTQTEERRDVLEAKSVNVLDSGATTTCGKCVKRRHSIDEKVSENSIPKKPKSDNQEVKSQGVEPMQTEQISSLVNIFSSSFGGLLTSSKVENDNGDQQSLSQMKSSDMSQKFCSSLIKGKLESLARPVLAMSV